MGGLETITWKYDVEGDVYYIELSCPYGNGGGGFYVTANNIHLGQIVKRTEYNDNLEPVRSYWQPYVKLGKPLTGDDLDAIMDVVNDRFPL